MSRSPSPTRVRAERLRRHGSAPAHNGSALASAAPSVAAPERDTESRIFPGWRWVAVALAFPVAGLIGRAAGGPVDELGAALLGGVLTGAALGAGEWLAAPGMFGRAWGWIAASGAGYGVGLAAGAALVGYDTGLADLAAMGAVSGLALGVAQGLALAAEGRKRLAVAWAAAMPALFALGWVATTLAGIDVDRQFTLFGAAGAVAFMLLSGLLLARVSRP
jgi:hypothetical protein